MLEYHELDDNELTDLVRKNDEQAFAEIYQRYWTIMYMHALKMLRNEEDAYNASDLLNDIRNDLFSPERAAPKYYDQLLQSIYLDRILSLSSLNKTATSTKAIAEKVAAATDDDNCFDLDDLTLPSSKDLYFQFMTMALGDKQFKIESLALAEIKRIKTIVEKRIPAAKGEVLDHYQYLLKRIQLFLN